ncbi:hypothetical protein [Flavobacterium sp.]|jgi:hypothetical protein|uniref:hypothetical protein n=1 Tax=Flavobacterium sp. TaxID=239 RepID=UPI0037BF132A
MNHKELADYIEADIETRYEIHKVGYFKLYPNATLDKFHSFTVTHLKLQTEKYLTKKRVTPIDPTETELYNAEIEVMDYIQNLKGDPLNDRYLINSNFWEQEKTKLDNIGFQREIEKHGFFKVKAGTETVKIYNPQLTVILISIELPVKNLDTQTETAINCWEFLMTYIKGYKRGEQFFENKIMVSPTIIYSPNAKQFIIDIHMKYFHVQHGKGKGWVYVKNVEPSILTHELIEEYGYYSGLVNKVRELIIEYPEQFASFENYEHHMQPQQTKKEHETIELKPVLKPEAVQIVFDIIKDFFSVEQQTELKMVIETGRKATNKMLFKGHGNRLSDTFKKLIEHDFITGCQKQDLINWIISNFTYTQNDTVKDFVYDTVEKTISRNYYPCKSPLITIENGQIQKVVQPRTKNYNKY